MYSRYYENRNFQMEYAEDVQKLFDKLGIETMPVNNGNRIIKIKGLVSSPFLRYRQDIFVEWSITDHRFMFIPNIKYFSKEDKKSGFITYNGEKYNPYANCVEDIVEVKKNILNSIHKQIVESHNTEIINALNNLD